MYPETLPDLGPDPPVPLWESQLPAAPSLLTESQAASQVTTWWGPYLAQWLQLQAEEPARAQHWSSPERTAASTAKARTGLEKPAQQQVSPTANPWHSQQGRREGSWGGGAIQQPSRRDGEERITALPRREAGHAQRRGRAIWVFKGKFLGKAREEAAALMQQELWSWGKEKK